MGRQGQARHAPQVGRPSSLTGLYTHSSSVAAFKYRHMTREGHYEDSLPTLNEEHVSVCL